MRRRGFVLVSVMWVLVLLTMITLGFGHRALLDHRAAVYSVDHAQARMMARGAVSRGLMVLRNKTVDDWVAGEGHMTHLGQPWARSENLLDDPRFFTAGEDFAEDFCRYVILDGSARVNINSAPEEMLAGIESLDPAVRRRILVRRTEGDHDGEGGAMFHAPEELRYFRGVSDDDWFGTRRRTGLKDIVSVEGGPMINVNTATAEVLACIPNVGDREIRAIMAHRAGPDGEIGTADDQGFVDMTQLSEITGIEGQALESLKRFAATTSSIFIVQGTATRRQGRIRAQVSATVFVDFEQGRTRVLSWQEAPLGA